LPLTAEQRDALWEVDGSPWLGHRLVSARPGTGKTSTLTEYCIGLLDKWPLLHAPWQGLAVISYTNVAKVELERKIGTLGRASEFLSTPHFVGTIDAFTNQFIFLPFGDRHMHGWIGRPRLVGPPYGTWRASWEQIRKNPQGSSSPIFFDCYTLGVAGPMLVDRTQRMVGNRARTATPVTPANSQKILAMKRYMWSLGYATQSDANYISYKTIEASAQLARALIQRFPVLVVDEAQDMTTVQHALIDHLRQAGHEHIILVGDEYQAIYEWNTARPQLFIEKKRGDGWNGRSLTATFRCSGAICVCLTKLANDGSASLAPAKDSKNRRYRLPVSVIEYQRGDELAIIKASIAGMVDRLAGSLPHDGNNAGLKTVAVLGRSQADAALLQTVFTGTPSTSLEPVLWGERLTRDLLKVLHYLTRRDLYAAFVAYETLIINCFGHASREEMRVAAESRLPEHSSGVERSYRSVVFSDLQTLQKALPRRRGLVISECRAACEVVLTLVPKASLRKILTDIITSGIRGDSGDRSLATLFTDPLERIFFDHTDAVDVRVFFSTVHGVKGETYDGVVFFTKEQTGPCGCPSSSNRWRTILSHSLMDCEAKRVVYVAISRAAQALTILAPDNSVAVWRALCV
jgi:DNA helicase-2/ATP-dependent DNA helicase PcrA